MMFDIISYIMGYTSGKSAGSSVVTVSPLSVTDNGTYTAPSGEAYSPVTVNVSGGGQPSASPNAVNFIDYDGTILYGYSETDALSLAELPANPTHSGLNAQGWNWTLAQIKARLSAMPGAPVLVGQKYITDDGKTRIYCHFETGRLAPYLGLGVNGTVTVDWGDGTDTDTLTGTLLTTAITVQHVFPIAGDYTITLTPTSGSFEFFGMGNITHILKKNTNTDNLSHVYANAIQRIEMGENASIGGSAFSDCSSLASITIPDGVTSIDDSAFYNCSSLASITIPDGVTSIGGYAFQGCYGFGELHFLPSTPQIVYSSNAFSSIQTDCIIYVPAGSLAAYTSATNYPSSRTYTYIEE